MYAENFDSGCLLKLFVYRRVIFVSVLLRRKRQNFPARPDIMEGTGGRSMVTVYADVLVGMNLYVTWFLLLASERLAGVRSSALRRGLAALCGGLASLLIFLPELPFPLLFFGKLLLAAGIVWIAGGYGGWRRFCKEMIFFFAANFLFAGAMIALWLAFSPPRLVIRNGAVYYHISALTLAVCVFPGTANAGEAPLSGGAGRRRSADGLYGVPGHGEPTPGSRRASGGPLSAGDFCAAVSGGGAGGA